MVRAGGKPRDAAARELIARVDLLAAQKRRLEVESGAVAAAAAAGAAAAAAREAAAAAAATANARAEPRPIGQEQAGVEGVRGAAGGG